MKRLFILMTLLLLILSGCGRSEPEASDIRTLLMQKPEDYFTADEDFIKTNFGLPHYVKTAEVYLSRAGDGREIGFFLLTDTAYCEQQLLQIRDYLASEEESVRALAALYPADELQARLERFQHAKVGCSDRLVYYALTD